MNNLGINLEGQHVVVDAEYMLKEFSAVEDRIMFVRGGFGARPDTIGRAVLGDWVKSGIAERVEGYMIERLATPEEVEAARP